MNSRIRYIKDSDGKMSGNKYYKSADGFEYLVNFVKSANDESYIGYVYEVGSDGAAPYTVTAPSPHKIKIALKKQLESLGCVFEKETRTSGE